MVRVLWVVSCLFLSTLAAPGARAGGGPTDALIERAARAYTNLDFEKSLRILNQALAQKGNSREQLVRIHHLTGLGLGAIGRYDIARQAFERLLALDPTFRLGADVSPRVRKPFDELVKLNPRRIEVRSLPPPHAQLGKPLVMTFEVVNDKLGMARSIQVWYRRGAAGAYNTIRAALKGEGEHRVSIPAPAWESTSDADNLSWYAEVEGDNRSVLQNFGDAMHPAVLEVIDQATAEKLADAEKRWYKRWWVWTIIGGVVAAGAATAVVLTTSSEPSGPFDFKVDFSTTP